MKYMLKIYNSESAWTREEWTQCTMDSSAVCHDLHAQGNFISASPLHPVSAATSVRIREGRRLVTDGPFAETPEFLGGYYLIHARDLNEAISIAGRHSGARVGTVEVRRIFELLTLPDV